MGLYDLFNDLEGMLSPARIDPKTGQMQSAAEQAAEVAPGAAERAASDYFVRPAANAAMLFNKLNPGEASGIPSSARSLDETARRMVEEAGPRSETGVGQLTETAIETPIALAALLGPTKVLGPIAGLAAYGGLSAADQGIVPAAEAAGMNAMFGAVLHGTARAPAPLRALAAGATTYLFGKGEPETKRIATSLAFGALGAIGPGRARAQLDELAARATMPRGTPEPEIPAPEPGGGTLGEHVAASEAAVADAEGARGTKRTVVQPGYDPNDVRTWNDTQLEGSFTPEARAQLEARRAPVARESTPEEVAKIRGPERPWQEQWSRRLRGEPEPAPVEQPVVDPLKPIGPTGKLPSELAREAAPAEPPPPEAPVEPPAGGGAPVPPGPPLTPEQTREGFRAIIGPREQAKQKIGDRIRDKGFDDLHGLLMGERMLEGGQVSDGAYEAARRLRGVGEIANSMLDRGVPEYVPDPNVKGGTMLAFKGKPLLDILAGPLKAASRGAARTTELEDTLNYGIARQANELSAQGREKLVSPELIKAGLDLETPARKQAMDELQGFQRQVAKFGRDSGLFNDEQMAKWNRNEFLWSFNREMGDQPGRSGKGGLGGGRGVFSLRGSERNLRDPIESIVGGPSRLIRLGLENQAKLKIADWTKNPKAEGLIRRVQPGVEQVRVRSEEATRSILKGFEGNDAAKEHVAQLLKSDGALPEFLEMWKGRATPPGDNIMTVFRDGKAEHYEILNPLVKSAIDNFNRPSLQHPVINFFGTWKRLAQQVVTATPSFLVRNGVRDPIAATVFSQTGWQHLTASLRGWKAAFDANDPALATFIANGGGGSEMRAGPEAMRQRVLRHAVGRGLNPKDIITLPIDAVRWAVNSINDVGQKVELGPRLGEFKRAQEQGASAGHAAYLGRDVSTDFGMLGSDPAIRTISKVTPFFSAMLASTDRFYRGVTEPSQRVAVATKIGAIAALSVMLHALNREDEEFNKLPDWDRNGYWHLPKPGGGWVRIPKAWEIGSIGSIAERLYDSVYASDQVADKNLALDVLKIAQNNFSIGAGPPLLETAAEQWANKIMHTGSPIEPPGLQDLDPWQRATSGTSPTMVALGRAQRGLPKSAQISPARGEALVRGLFSYYGEYGLWASDHLFFPGTTNLNWDDEPVIGSFIERPGRYNKSRDEFYQMLEDTNGAHASMMKAAHAGDREVVQEYAAQGDAALSTAFDRAQRVISALNKTITSIKNDTKMPADEKRTLYNDKVRERDGLMEQMVALGKRARAAKKEK